MRTFHGKWHGNIYRVPVGSGAIYAMVIGLWALVLLPSWIRNHEKIDEGKQVDRFRRAMAQLSSERVSHMEMLVQTDHKQVQAKRATRAGTVAPTGLTPAARRRRVLAVLSLLLLATVVATPFGSPAWATQVSMGLIGVFLIASRTQVKAERARRTEGTTDAPRASSTFSRTLAAARAARRAEFQQTGVVEQAPAAPTIGGWQPVRTPAPSYVSAPAATAVPRAIDGAGGWTGSAMVEAARASRSGEIDAMAEQSLGVTSVGDVVAVDDTTAEIPVVRFTA